MVVLAKKIQADKMPQTVMTTLQTSNDDDVWYNRVIGWIPFSFASTPVKNLRIYSIMIAIHHVIVSHLCMFLVVMALLHAEEMINILVVDIADQKDREEYYELPMHANGETMNQVRFKSATKLAAGTINVLYVCAGVVGVYMVCCLSLLCGTIRYRSQMLVPWLVVHAGLRAGSIFIAYHNQQWFLKNALNDSVWVFWAIVAFGVLMDVAFWSLIYRYYIALRCMQKLTKSATVAIPYPELRRIPYHFRKDNMYVGDGGYKHCVTTDNINYVV